MEETAMHLPCVQSMISFLGRALSYAGDRHAERTQGEFREIPATKKSLLPLLYPMREQKSTNQGPSSDQQRFGGHHSLARDAKPIALRPMASPGNCLDGMEEIEVPEPCLCVD